MRNNVPWMFLLCWLLSSIFLVAAVSLLPFSETQAYYYVHPLRRKFRKLVATICFVLAVLLGSGIVFFFPMP